MDPHEFFLLYRATHRGLPVPGFRLEVLPHIVRYTAEAGGRAGFVGFADFEADRAAEIIDEQIGHFERAGQDFEWKIYDFDRPDDLRGRLEARGFIADDREAFMAGATNAWPAPAALPAGIVIAKVSDVADLARYVALESEIWGEDLSRRADEYREELAAEPGGMSIYWALQDGEPVGVGRVRFPRNSPFAGLWGGAVHPRMRGRGIFTALVATRMAEAKARGYPWMTIDAGPMSRPIMEAKGFQHVCWTYPMIRRRTKAEAAAPS